MRRSEFIAKRKEFYRLTGDPSAIAESEAKLAEWAGVKWDEEEEPLPPSLFVTTGGEVAWNRASDAQQQVGRLVTLAPAKTWSAPQQRHALRIIHSMVDAYNRERRAEYRPGSPT